MTTEKVTAQKDEPVKPYVPYSAEEALSIRTRWSHVRNEEGLEGDQYLDARVNTRSGGSTTFLTRRGDTVEVLPLDQGKR